MKVGYIAKSNKKGQIVIPKGVRDALGITGGVSFNMIVRENAVYMHPIKEVLGESSKDDFYIKLLEKTQGAWKEDEEDWKRIDQEKRKIELAESKKRKAW